MYLCCAELEENRDYAVFEAFLPPERRGRLAGRESAGQNVRLAYALLGYGLKMGFHLPFFPIRYSEAGKPGFMGCRLHFSLSHTKTHALCLLGREPVGADIETKRDVSPAAIKRALSRREDPGDFFAHWTLKESYIKLIGKKDRPFSGINFEIYGEKAVFEGENVHGALYPMEMCWAAVCARGPFEAPPLHTVTYEMLRCVLTDKTVF